MTLPGAQIVGFEAMPLALQMEMVASVLEGLVPTAGNSGIAVSDGAPPLLDQWRVATDAYQQGTLPADQFRTRMMEIIGNHQALYVEIRRRSGSSAPPTTTRFSRTPPTAALLARAPQATGEQERWRLITELGLQVLAMGDADFEIMRAGGVPPKTPAATLVEMLDGLIRAMTGKVLKLWRRRGIKLDYDETRLLMRAALPLFLKKTKWSPKRSNLFVFVKKYFYFFFERVFLMKNDSLLRAHATARIAGTQHAPYQKPQRAARDELRRRHLLPYKPTRKEADKGMTPVWERVGLQNGLSPAQGEQLVLAVGHSVYLLLRNPSINQNEKEAFLARYRGRKILEAVGDVVGVSREEVRKREKTAMEIWRSYLEDALEEAGMTRDFIRHCLETPEVLKDLRDSLSMDELAKVMSAADFDRERWKFLAKQMPEVIPPF